MTDRLPGQAIDIPVVPELAETIGYRDEARFVGVYQLEWSDDISITDGVNTRSGNSWAFQSFRRHRAVAPLLEGVNLGSLDDDPSHMLLIDREGSRASIAPIIEARAFLKDQWPPEPPLSPAQREEIQRHADELMAKGWQEIHVDGAEIQRQMAEQRGRMGRMMSFLDMCPEPPERGR